MPNEITIDISDVRHALGHKDFTVFESAEGNSPDTKATESLAKRFAADCEIRQARYRDKTAVTAPVSTNEQINLIIEDKDKKPSGADTQPKPEPYTSRSCMCLAYQGRYVSATFRTGKKLAGLPDKEWQPPSQLGWRPQEQDSEHRIQIGDVVNYLRLRLDQDVIDPDHPRGVIVVAGGTKSGKSELARCLALGFIAEMVRKDQSLRQATLKYYKQFPNGTSPPAPSTRVPHLVTCEDPVEAWKLHDNIRIDESPIRSLERGFNFTPRELDKDVESLAEALKDARRQTPACFYIGEVRNATDWAEILDFAGSGHLAIVTTHAASTVDAIVRILAAARATTPSDRRQYVGNIACIVHPVLHHGYLLPSVWLGTSKAVNGLVSDGPSAAMANDDYSLSRRQFVRQMTDNLRVSGQSLGTTIGGEVLEEVLKVAMELDLQELRRP